MARAAGKIYLDPEIGEVMFCKSIRSSRMSIRVHPEKGVKVMVPYIIPYSVAQMFFQSRRQWVVDTIARQKEKYKDVPKMTFHQIEELRARAKAELPPRLEELAARHGFKYNRVTIKHNVSNWGSCSARSNINLNLNIVRLPKVLQDYVLLHELCHLRHQDHGHAFHLLLEHVLTVFEGKTPLIIELKPEKKIVRLNTTCVNQDGKTVVSGVATVKFDK